MWDPRPERCPLVLTQFTVRDRMSVRAYFLWVSDSHLPDQFIGPPTSPWGSYQMYQPPVPQPTTGGYQYDPHNNPYLASHESSTSQPSYGRSLATSERTSWASSTSLQTPKTSVTLTLSCPTPACRGVLTANGVSIDAIELKVNADVEDTIRQVFTEEIGTMG